jgi:hypothetical protein
MHELLLYCLTPMERLTAGGTGSTGSSSSSNRQQRAGAQRFEVCAVSEALLEDGVALLSQTDPQAVAGAKMATCDACCARKSLENATTGAAAFMGGLYLAQLPPAVATTCTACDGHAWFCKDCRKESSTAWQQHMRCCSPGGGEVQQAWVGALEAAGADNGIPLDCEVCASNVSREGRCRCSTCLALLDCRGVQVQNRWTTAPMVQHSGPWQPQQAPGVLPPSLASKLPLPPHIMQCVTQEAGELPRRSAAVLHAFYEPLLEAAVSFNADIGKCDRPS